jgi:transposase
MANARDSARTYGKSDPIDALAVARAALREPDLPLAQLDGPSRELRLLVDHREDLVKDRTRHINRLRWHLHELDPEWDPPARSMTSYRTLNGTAPLPAWSGNRNRHRLSRTGNWQLNAAIHRIAITQLAHNPDARAFRDRRITGGDTPTEALRALKRRLSDVVYRALQTDTEPAQPENLAHAA